MSLLAARCLYLSQDVFICRKMEQMLVFNSKGVETLRRGCTFAYTARRLELVSYWRLTLRPGNGCGYLKAKSEFQSRSGLEFSGLSERSFLGAHHQGFLRVLAFPSLFHRFMVSVKKKKKKKKKNYLERRRFDFDLPTLTLQESLLTRWLKCVT